MNALFILLGLLCFLLATFGVEFMGLSLGWLGLFFVFLPQIIGAARTLRG